jgi:hypothetical protein
MAPLMATGCTPPPSLPPSPDMAAARGRGRLPFQIWGDARIRLPRGPPHSPRDAPRQARRDPLELPLIATNCH